MNGETNLDVLISSMKPRINSGEYVFCSLNTMKIDINQCLFFFRESEGITIVCTKAYADEKEWVYSSTFAWLTLEVHSALEAVGLTAAFSQALGANNISCNVVAGFYHDHIFVPMDKGREAVRVLDNLAKNKEIRDPSV
jgi:uncharacterized protein